MNFKNAISFFRLPISTGALYVRKYFDEESKREASDMIANIQYEFRNILEKATWMDDSTKKEALRKAKALVSHIGYPSELTDNAKLEKYYETLEIERDNWLVNVMRIRKFDVDLLYGLLREPTNKTDWKNHATPAVVNAFYNPLENSIREYRVHKTCFEESISQEYDLVAMIRACQMNEQIQFMRH